MRYPADSCRSGPSRSTFRWIFALALVAESLAHVGAQDHGDGWILILTVVGGEGATVIGGGSSWVGIVIGGDRCTAHFVFARFLC